MASVYAYASVFAFAFHFFYFIAIHKLNSLNVPPSLMHRFLLSTDVTMMPFHAMD